MKNNHRKKIVPTVVCLLAAAVIAISAFEHIGGEKLKSYIAYFSYSDAFSENHKPLSTANFDRLNETQKKAYICIFNQIKKHPEYIKVPVLTQEEFSEVYFSVKNDNPDMLCFSDSCNMIRFSAACLLQLHYDYDKDDCDKKTKVLSDETERIIAGMPSFDSDYEKELFLHDYIVSVCSYEETSDASNAYGCLVSGKAVCSGYSRAMMLLLNRVSVPSMLISGNAQSDTGDISHMWNIVWLAGDPYHLDVTWDDSDTEDASDISHLYFNVTQEQIAVNHSAFSVDVACTATDFNYFAYENLLFSDYSSETLRLLCRKIVENIGENKNFTEFAFTTKEAYDKAFAAIINNSTHDSDMYKIVRYVDENTENMVDTSHVNFSKDDSRKYIKIQFDFV